MAKKKKKRRRGGGMRIRKEMCVPHVAHVIHELHVPHVPYKDENENKRCVTTCNT